MKGSSEAGSRYVVAGGSGAGAMNRRAPQLDRVEVTMNLILIGPPGAGKGTQAMRLRERYGLTHISTGDIFRAMDTQSERGREVSRYMEQGALVPDELTIKVVLDRLEHDDCREGWLLDGFPRTVPQAEALDRALAQKQTPNGAHVDTVVNIEVDDDEIIQRLAGRRVAPQSGRIYHVEYNPPRVDGVCDDSGETLVQRSDDRPEAIRERLNKFHEQTAPLIPYYQTRGVLKTVSGTGKMPDDVSAQIWEALD